MPKRIPINIQDTIESAIFEVRFQLKINENELLGRLFPIFQKTFPKFEPTNQHIPAPLRSLDPQFQYLADYKFSNENLAVAFGKRALVFEYLSDYKGWVDFYGHLNLFLREIGKLDIFQSTERIGLRYINLIKDNIAFKDAVDLNLTVGLENHIERNIVFRDELQVDNVLIILNIAENGTVTKLNAELKKGILIDVDVIQTENLPIVGSELLPLISDLHEKEKYVFFNILRQQFIDSRNPKY